MLDLRTAIVLPRNIGVHAKMLGHGKDRAEYEAVAGEPVEARVVVDLGRAIRRERVALELDVSLELRALADTGREISIDEAQVFAGPKAQEELPRQSKAKRLFQKDAVLGGRIVRDERRAIAIAGAHGENIIEPVIKSDPELAFEAGVGLTRARDVGEQDELRLRSEAEMKLRFRPELVSRVIGLDLCGVDC